jgi:DNA polymerase/3'-5' exonuclease PolX
MSQPALFSSCEPPAAPGGASHVVPDWPLAILRDVAGQVKDLLSPACDRIEVAGSIRRGKPRVRDIDLVAIPRHLRTDIGNPVWRMEFVDAVRGCDRWTIHSSLHNTSRSVKLRSVADPRLKIELWLAPPERFGWIHLLRTGDHEFTHELVARAPMRGVKFADGEVLVNHAVRACPDESDVFAAVGLPFIEPHERTRERLRQLWAATGRA